MITLNVISYDFCLPCLLIQSNIFIPIQENCEQKEQDIIEENILLREEISHLTERLRKARVNDVCSYSYF